MDIDIDTNMDMHISSSESTTESLSDQEFYRDCVPPLYRYSGLDVINTRVEYLDVLIKDKRIFEKPVNVHMCCYRVNNNGKYPFLEFMLVKKDIHENECEGVSKEEDQKDTLVFPTIQMEKVIFKEELISECDCYLYSTLIDYTKNIDSYIIQRFENNYFSSSSESRIDEDEESIEDDANESEKKRQDGIKIKEEMRGFVEMFCSDFNYQGCYYEETEEDDGVDNLYLFYDITPLNIDQYDIYKMCNVRFAIVDEILNYGHICNIPIDRKTQEFFSNNRELLFLYDGDMKYYESPVIAYTGTYDKNLYFKYLFGQSATSKEDITKLYPYMGPYFYFTNFVNAVHQGGWVTSSYENNVVLKETKTSKEEFIEMMQKRYKDIVSIDDNGRYGQCGIVRHALFLGKTLVKLNYPEDKVDVSPIKKQLLEKEYGNQGWEKLTERITDYDGSWSNFYDSVFIGLVELDNGEVMDGVPIWVTKEYSQQVSLSYHYIDKKTMGYEFDDVFNTYSIL
jgi:hypothetical protein